MVIVAVGMGVFVIVTVAEGGTVIVGVALGPTVLVGGNRIFPMLAQDCNNTIANVKTIRYLLIHNLFHAIIL